MKAPALRRIAQIQHLRIFQDQRQSGLLRGGGTFVARHGHMGALNGLGKIHRPLPIMVEAPLGALGRGENISRPRRVYQPVECAAKRLHSCSAKKRSASSAAMQPMPAEVIAWRYL